MMYGRSDLTARKATTISATGKSHARRPAGAPAHGGFTLIEVLVALALSLLLLSAATSLLVTFSVLWTQEETEPWYNEHVDGLDRFLRASFAGGHRPLQKASEATEEEPPADDEGRENPPESPSAEERELETPPTSEPEEMEPRVRLRKLPGERGFADPLVSFELSGDLPLMRTGKPQPPVVTAYLKFSEEEGLVLIWHGEPEAGRERPDLHSLRLSPYVRAVRFAYFEEDFKEWEVEEEPRENAQGEPELPDFIELELRLEEDDEPRVLTFLLPPEKMDVPLY